MKAITEKECQTFNETRINNQGKTFASKEICEILSKIFNVNVDSYVLSFFVNNWKDPVIIKTERNNYVFPEYPIYIEKLQNVWNRMIEDRKKYNSSYYKKKKQEYSNEEQEKPLEERIQDAIVLLKENGYQVRKITILYEEV